LVNAKGMQSLVKQQAAKAGKMGLTGYHSQANGRREFRILNTSEQNRAGLRSGTALDKRPTLVRQMTRHQIVIISH